MYEQLYGYLSNYLNDVLRGFLKGNSTLHALFRLIQEKPRQSRFGGIILMDLSKTWLLPSWPSIAKPEAYGFGKRTFSLVNDYLNFRKQRTKIDSSYSDWANFTWGIHQGSILGRLLWYILPMIFSYLLKYLMHTILLRITHYLLVEIISQ